MRGRELPALRAHGEVVPDFLTAADMPWLRPLCDAAAAMAGVPRRQAAQRLLLLAQDPRAGRRGPFAARCLAAMLPSAARALGKVAPAELRLALAAAVQRGGDVAAARAAVAAACGLEVAALQAALLADLPGERLLLPMAVPPATLRLQANRELARRLLRRALAARLSLRGQVRAVVRQLRLCGGDAEVRGQADGEVELDVVSPPRRLGRALGALLGLLPWCERFRLRARLGGELPGLLVLDSGDGLLPGPEPRRFDSEVERAFAREFAALGSPWQLGRETAAVAVGGTLQFPDFELRHADGRRVLLEIAAFWRPDYLPRKLALLAQLGAGLLLCVDDGGRPGEALPPAVLRFRRRLRAAAVLQALERR